jgi:hypothetical protein
MEHGADVKTGLGQLAHDGVDEERAVILDDFQEIEAKAAIVDAGGWAQANLQFPGRALFGERPHIRQLGGKVSPTYSRRIIDAHIIVNLIDEVGLGGGKLSSVELFFKFLSQGSLHLGNSQVAIHGKIRIWRRARDGRRDTTLPSPRDPDQPGTSM